MLVIVLSTMKFCPKFSRNEISFSLSSLCKTMFHGRQASQLS